MFNRDFTDSANVKQKNKIIPLVSSVNICDAFNSSVKGSSLA